MAEDIVKVNLFLVGAAKAGTTSVYSYLGNHPEVYISPIKEPNYFATDIDVRKFSPVFKNNLFTDLDGYFKKDELDQIQQAFVTDKDQYEKLFQKSEVKINCDCSTSYLSSTEAAKNIYEYNPEAKILIILREPYDRLYSHYLMALRYGFTTLPLIDAVYHDLNKKNKGIGQSEMFVELSLYAEQIQRYVDIFPPNQLKILFFEDLRSDKQVFMDQVFDFIGIDKINLDEQGVYNEAQLPRNLKLNQWLTSSGIKKFFVQIAGNKIKNLLKSLYLTSGTKMQMTDGEEAYLEQFLEDVKKDVEKIIGEETPW